MSTAVDHRIRPPLWLLAELTYRCPLHCVFCSNPVDYARHARELDTAAWQRILGEARALGAVQLGFSGGEPLLRDDLEELVAHARQLGFYTNLITSGVGLTGGTRACAEGGGAGPHPAVVPGLDAASSTTSSARPAPSN